MPVQVVCYKTMFFKGKIDLTQLPTQLPRSICQIHRHATGAIRGPQETLFSTRSAIRRRHLDSSSLDRKWRRLPSMLATRRRADVPTTFPLFIRLLFALRRPGEKSAVFTIGRVFGTVARPRSNDPSPTDRHMRRVPSPDDSDSTALQHAEGRAFSSPWRHHARARR
jgi:hypothetical protein